MPAENTEITIRTESFTFKFTQNIQNFISAATHTTWNVAIMLMGEFLR